ncbi:NADH-quinone oxidoreductase subunit J [Roseateles depolymerans]|uniref:NADH-quinone oxidoreductase subunit J n=1 Tax=Roseateles depolymerans TaxID=76731 RepID=A0A0U3E2Q3_9BURK|nr:NADH-quinone oxidoreductase subunit J [Roseateles depolymerans]ALV07461.1 NADH:ubiquinone oxidoreductase subunit J [Roseateles depolymerans]REG22324.1 NADH dehydrogenase subunit J [Roseateles depolymerans]
MNITTLLFYFFSVVLLGSSVLVITARSTVYSALFLILAFFNASCIWMMLKAEFLAITLVLVYIGAVMVLFLFVVMMLDFDSDTVRKGFWKHVPAAGLIGAFIALEMALILMPGFRVSEAQPVPEALAKLGNAKLLGINIYTHYLAPLQIAAVLLLVAIIAAIALTLRGRKDSRHQDPSEQVRVKKGDRLRIVKVAPTVEQPAVPVEKNEGAA